MKQEAAEVSIEFPWSVEGLLPVLSVLPWEAGKIPVPQVGVGQKAVEPRRNGHADFPPLRRMDTTQNPDDPAGLILSTFPSPLRRRFLAFGS